MIHDIYPINTYCGNNSTTIFDFDFYIENKNQLNVYYYNSEGVSTKLVYGIDYSVNEFKNPNGSYITYPLTSSTHGVLTQDEKITLELTLPISQEIEYNNSSLLNLEALEYSFDYLTRICQIINRQVTRAIKVAEGSNIDTDELAYDLTKVADIANDISTVANISANVTAVKNNAENINTVAGDILNVNAVGGSINDVNTVSADLENIDTVAQNITDVNTVAGDITNVNSTASDLENIDLVASDLTNIDLVASDLDNIDSASQNAQLSKDWANKMTGTVDGVEFSAKYYAQQASSGQVQSNWSETDTTSKAYIQNKPTKLSDFTDDLIPSQAGNSGKFLTTNGTVISWEDVQSTSLLPSQTGYAGKYLKTNGSIASWEDVPAAQIQSDWAQSDNTAKDFIKNKPTIPTVPTTLSSFTDDLGSSPMHTHSQYLTTHQDISGKEDILKAINVLSTSGTITLTDNSINSITPTGNITFSLPVIATVEDNTKFHQILIQIDMSTVYTIDLGLGSTPHWLTDEEPDLSNAGNYNLYFEYDKVNQYWRAGVLAKGEAS